MKSYFPSRSSTWAAFAILSGLFTIQTPSALAQSSAEFTCAVETDPDGKQYLSFPTLPGYHYTVETSSDLESFLPASGGFFYGNGDPHRFFFLQGPVPGTSSGSGPDNGGNPEIVARTIAPNISFWTDAADVVHCFFAVAEHGNPVIGAYTVEISANFPRRSQLVIIDAAPASSQNLFFFYFCNFTVLPPGSANPFPSATGPAALPDAQREEVTVFLDHLAEINGQLSRPDTTPPAPPPDPNAPPTRSFFRVILREIDTNGNGLFDWWELANGFAPFATATEAGFAGPNDDTDGDGLTNAHEAALDTDPNKSDTDGDGAPDGYEHSEGTDPKSATSTPLMLRVERRAVDYWYHQGPGGGASAGWAEFYQTWSLSGPEYYSLPSAIPLTELDEELAAYAVFPPAPSPSAEFVRPNIGTSFSGSGFSLPGTYSGEAYTDSGTPSPMEQGRIWATISPAPTQPVERSFLLVTDRTPAITGNADAPKVVTLTIPAGATQSPPYDVLTAFAADGDGSTFFAEWVWIDLLPVEIEVKRGGVGNNADEVPTTPTWRSQGGTVRDVVSVWDAHTSSTQVADLKGDWMQVRVNLGGQAAANLPANFVTWSIDGHPAPAPNTLETPRLSWPGNFGAKTIQVTVGGKVFKVHVYVPNVGAIGHADWVALVLAVRTPAIGGPAVLLARDYGTAETAWSSGYAGTPAQQNALRHSSWIAHCASAITIGPALARSLGYAHENDNFSSGNNWAYESTMDIHNNNEGVASVHSTWLENPDTTAIRADVVAKLTSGVLWIWDGPGAEHTGFKATLKSDNTPIFP